MENATKALLIAAAILIAILIISLALVVYNMASETMNGLNLSEAEILSFNDKFLQYEGTSVTGSQVNAMLRTVDSNNIVNQDTNSGKHVNVYKGDTGTEAFTSADTGKRYTVKCEKNANSGLINIIRVTEKASS